MTDLEGITATRGPVRTAATSLWLGIIGVVMAALGAVGSGQGLWPFAIGLLMVAVAFLLGVIGLLFALFAALRKPAGSPLGRRIGVGFLLCGAVLAAIGPWIYRGVAFPPIHDVTTNLANPPAFLAIPLRKDNLAGVASLDEWRRLHRAAYADIVSVRINKAPGDVIARATTLATERGWIISPSVPGQLEATATESPFKFKDVIVVVATAEADGTSTRVNMRSVSQVGASDFGVNAKRIREFLKALQN